MSFSESCHGQLWEISVSVYLKDKLIFFYGNHCALVWNSTKCINCFSSTMMGDLQSCRAEV